MLEIHHSGREPSICSSVFPAISLRFTIFGEIFEHVAFLSFFFFSSDHRGSHIPSSQIVHAECIFVAGIHPSKT